MHDCLPLHVTTRCESNHHPVLLAVLFIVTRTVSRRKFNTRARTIDGSRRGWGERCERVYFPWKSVGRASIRVGRELCISILPFRSNLDRRNHRNYWIIYRPDAARREIFFPSCGAPRSFEYSSNSGRNSNLSNRYLIFTGFAAVWIIAFYETSMSSGWQDLALAIKGAFDLRIFALRPVNGDNFSGETLILENSGIWWRRMGIRFQVRFSGKTLLTFACREHVDYSLLLLCVLPTFIWSWPCPLQFLFRALYIFVSKGFHAV